MIFWISITIALFLFCVSVEIYKESVRIANLMERYEAEQTTEEKR